jgi:Flagellar hook-length control protein FliK
MQSALAFLSIPLTAPESRVPPEVQISTSDSSFADAVLLSESDVQSKDATPVDALPALAWIGLPVLPVAVPPPSLAATSEAGRVAFDPADAIAAALSDAVVASADSADAIADVAESLPETGLETGLDAKRPDLNGSAALPEEGFTVGLGAPTAGLAERVSKPKLADDAQAVPLRPDAVNPARSTNPGPPAVPFVDAQVATAPQANLPSSTEVRIQPEIATSASQPERVEASGPAPGALGRSPVPLAEEPLAVGSPPKSVIASERQPVLEAKVPGQAVQKDAPGLVTEPAGPEASPQPADPESPDGSVPPTLVQPSETLETPPAPAPGSFWERFFVDLDLPPGEPVHAEHAAEREGAPGLAKPLEALQVAPALPAVSGPGLVLSQATAPLERAERSSKDEDRLAEPAAPTMPKARRLPGVDQPALPAPPVVLVEDWNGSLVDPAGSADNALSSALSTGTVPLLSSVPSSSASAAQAPSLPVPQVAAQLAGVLLRSTDKTTELALAPEELGRVRLRLEPDSANPDRMVILISVERPETLDLFRRHAGELAEAIRAAGYSGADIGFDQQGQGQGQDRQQPPDMFGISKTPEDQGPTQPALRHATGANLDLRL